MELTTRYLGLELNNPLIASASPLSKTVDGVRRLVDAGVGAVVLYSLFEEQLSHETEDQGPRRYLSLLERAVPTVSVPVIGSINASAPGSWAGYARSMQDCGAAAIELNIYSLPGDSHVSGRDVEQRHLDILARVKDAVTVPVAVKLSPYFSATAEMARSLDLSGADGLVLFNRFLQPDIDIETLAVAPGSSLSRAAEAQLPLTWITLLRGRIGASLAATTGVEGWVELVKYLLAGADVVMTASALLRHGPEYAVVMLDGLRQWMAGKGYTSLDEVRGLLAVPFGTDEVAHERSDYVSALRRANRAEHGPW